MTIKELRTATGMTQKEFAEMLGVSKRCIESWEGGINPCPPYLPKLLEYYLRNENLIK